MSEQVKAVPRPVRADDLARHIGVCRKTVLRRIHAGEIEATKVGRAWLIPAAELARLSGIGFAA